MPIKNPLNSGSLPNYANQFWWVGGLGTSMGPTSSKDANDWNNKSNWMTWDVNNGYWKPASRVPGSTNAESDIVNIGGFMFGPTAYAPLLFGGFSGSSTTGGYADGVGATFAAGATNTNILLEVNIKWEYGNELKYPFTVVGGGVNSIYSLGVTNGSQTGASAAYGVTFGDFINDPHYKTLKVKTRRIKEHSSRASNKSIYLDLVKVVNESGTPIGILTKGNKIVSEYPETDITQVEAQYGNTWNGGPTSRSKLYVTGFLNSLVDESRPNATFITSRGDINQIKNEYGITGSGSLTGSLYGNPEVNIGWDDKGCTLGSYNGTNLCALNINNNSTVGEVYLSTLHCYNLENGANPHIGLDAYHLNILGEIDKGKAMNALGYTITGGITGAGLGVVTVDTNPQVLVGYRGATSGNNNIVIGNYLNFAGLTGVGYTGASRISRLNIVNHNSTILNSDYFTNLKLAGSLIVGQAYVTKTKISGWSDSQISSYDFGSVIMTNKSELLFNYAPNVNSWTFGILPDPGTTTQIVGGIFGDDTSVIKMSNGVALYNKNINTAVSNLEYKADSSLTTLTSINKFRAGIDGVEEVPLP